MSTWFRAGSSALVSGTIASLATTAVLAALAKAERKRAVQPTNATSHWLHGDRAAKVKKLDAKHTLVGYGTHHASAVFWALPFEAWRTSQPPRTPLLMLRDASVMAAIAAAIDYGAVPKRLTPGWEEVLSKRSITATYAVLALALAAGGLINQTLEAGDSAEGSAERAVGTPDRDDHVTSRAEDFGSPALQGPA